MLGQTIIYLGTRHQIGYSMGFTTAKLLKSGQYQKILNISALSGLALQYFLVLATFLEFNCISNCRAECTACECDWAIRVYVLKKS